MSLNRNIQKIFLSILTAAILTSAGFASAVAIPRQGEKLLLSTYHRHMASLKSNSYGLPLVVESLERDDKVHVDVYGIFDNSFSSVVSALKVPANWCDIIFLHPNIKACTYRKLPNEWMLTCYPGKKVYQPPEDARQVTYHYRVADQQQGYLNIILNADKGPFGTKNHRMRLEALPLDGGKTFVHVSYAYSDSTALRLAAKIYFATLARNKVGFTVTGKDGSGNPVYIGGPRGALERSAVRYYLAIQSFMDTLHYPEDMRFSIRTSTWHDRTARYRRQLFDLDKTEYIRFKTAEHTNQMSLQRLIVPGPH